MNIKCRLKKLSTICKVSRTNKEWFVLFRFFPFYPTKTDVILSEPAIKLSLKNVILSCGSRNAMMYSNGK